MSDVVVTIVRTVSATLQFVGVAYVALISWLMSGWMVDDSWAMRAADSDWWLVAGSRAAGGLMAAAVVGVLLLVINGALVHWKLASPKTRPIRTALIGAAVVGAASIGGAISFVIDRPFM